MNAEWSLRDFLSEKLSKKDYDKAMELVREFEDEKVGDALEKERST